MVNNRNKLPRCNGRPMMFAQEWTRAHSDFCRYRIVFPDGKVLYQHLDSVDPFINGCTSRTTQKTAFKAVSTYFDARGYEHGPLIFLGYL